MTLTDARADGRRAPRRCARPGVRARARRRTARETFARRRPGRAEPGRAAGAAGGRGARGARRAGHRRDRAGVALAARAAIVAITGTKGKSTTTTLIGPDARGRRAAACWWAATSACRSARRSTRRRRTRCTWSRRAASSSRRSTRSTRGSPCCSTSRPTTSIATRPSTAYARGQGADLREPDGRRLGGGQRRRARGAGAGRAQRARGSVLVRAATAAPTRRRSRSTACIVAAHVGRATCRSCRWRRCSCSGRHLLTRRPGGRGGRVDLAGAPPAAMTARASRLPRPRARDGAGGDDRRRPVRQRLEGHQRRGGAAVDRELRRGVVAILGGRFKGGDLARSARAARGRAAGRSWPSARRAPLVREALGATPCRCARRRRSGEAVRAACAIGAARTAWCCSRRRARASTCSATTRSAAGGSRRRCSRLAAEARNADG